MTLSFSPTNLPTQIFLNNEHVPSQSQRTFSVSNPTDGTTVCDIVPISDETDVNTAVNNAQAAFPSWKKLPGTSRQAILLRFASLIDQHAETLGHLNRLTLGAPYKAFGELEIKKAADAFRYYAGWIDKFAGETFPPENGFMLITRHEPLGVTAGIVPWNGPMGIMGVKAAPALATGNCFILKPSEKTPFSALALGELIREAGFPPGVFQVLSGDGSTGALLARHMKIRKVSFTGSVETGRKIQRMAAESNLKRVTLELGGKSPAVVFDDCDLGNAVSWCVNAITMNSGQTCIAASRVYVQEGVWGRFIEMYKAALEERAWLIGDPELETTRMGPLVDEAQFNRVTEFIAQGCEDPQATLLTGGKRVGEKGFYVEPTAFVGVQPESRLYQEEVFGPVAIVNSFRTEEEAIQRANATEYGLMAGVFTQDISKAMRVAGEFESGMVGINCVSLNFLKTPFGGCKQSGMGRECGRSALESYTEPKTIMVNLNSSL
ncbi:aldehyde dehydrogenase family protein [Aspergillus alliaceus]|uniref:aldehyde dehydrogenase family protein n=1 Tax=Petromyces alliaceus TaxID=209559 RepID=UPI0012A3DCCE|nr:aldehyde dehydrogenase domain-containing protein [Aspergillus alliaceus]KAB8236160.1 aldehyde dehydrogenase domain-containing protein [Aspergillus alliaceus]